MRIFALLHLVCVVRVGHVKLDLAEVRFQEPRQSLYPRAFCRLFRRVRMRMPVLRHVRM